MSEVGEGSVVRETKVVGLQVALVVSAYTTPPETSLTVLKVARGAVDRNGYPRSKTSDRWVAFGEVGISCSVQAPDILVL